MVIPPCCFRHHCPYFNKLSPKNPKMSSNTKTSPSPINFTIVKEVPPATSKFMLKGRAVFMNEKWLITSTAPYPNCNAPPTIRAYRLSSDTCTLVTCEQLNGANKVVHLIDDWLVYVSKVVPTGWKRAVPRTYLLNLEVAKHWTLTIPSCKPVCYHYYHDDEDTTRIECMSKGEVCPYNLDNVYNGNGVFFKNIIIVNNTVYTFLESSGSSGSAWSSGSACRINCTYTIIQPVDDCAAPITMVKRLNGYLGDSDGEVYNDYGAIVNDNYVLRFKHHVRDFAVYDRYRDEEWECKTNLRGYPRFVFGPNDNVYIVWRRGHRKEVKPACHILSEQRHDAKCKCGRRVYTYEGGLRIYDLVTKTLGPPLRTNLPYTYTEGSEQIAGSPWVLVDNGRDFIFNVRTNMAWTYESFVETIQLASCPRGDKLYVLVNEESYRWNRHLATYKMDCPIARIGTRRMLEDDRDARDVSPDDTENSSSSHLFSLRILE